MMDAEKALKILTKSADEAEIFFSKGISNDVEIKKGRIETFKGSSHFGYGVRAIKDKKMGFAFSNKLDEKVLQRAIDTAKIGERDKFLSLPEKQKYSRIGIYDKRIAELEVEDAMEFAEVLVSPCSSYSVIPTTGVISWSVSEVGIWNSNGVAASDKATTCACHLNAVAESESSGFYYEVSRALDLDFAGVGREAARLARDSLNAAEIGVLTTSLILKPHAVAELLENVLIHSFSADNVQRRRSILAGKVGEKIFSDLNIIDDGTFKHGLSTSKFDGEGVKSQRTELLKKGILKGYLYDTYAANKENAKSTGSAERDSYASLPYIDSSNFIVSGKGRIDEEGLVVHGLIGAHTSNPVSGDFSVETRNAFLNGKPVKKAIISGNIFDVLNKIEGFGKDYKQVSSVRAPTIQFKDVKVVS
ncbi:MAG: TldD/PmbA family protein [Euryarchaeota archaeon]|nr:TldD/PmbA family protein [Euryarchaeota archaeon]